jgi:hypothetical protein
MRDFISFGSPPFKKSQLCQLYSVNIANMGVLFSWSLIFKTQFRYTHLQGSKQEMHLAVLTWQSLTHILGSSFIKTPCTGSNTGLHARTTTRNRTEVCFKFVYGLSSQNEDNEAPCICYTNKEDVNKCVFIIQKDETNAAESVGFLYQNLTPSGAR